MTSSKYPRPVRDVHQIELTTRCQLRCQYCPQFPVLPRDQQDMTMDVFSRSLELVKHFVHLGTQTELSLTGIGESLLHPKFVTMVQMAREVLGPQRQITITTNGLLLTEALCSKLAPFKPAIFVSLHRPEKAGPAIEIAKKYGLLAGVNASFATASFNWVGHQKNWFVSAPRIPCEYLRSGWAVILVDGSITTCCLDSEAKPEKEGGGVIGTIWDAPEKLRVKPWSGCSNCHMEVSWTYHTN